jgi:uncharacterized protein with HEPN domain
VLDFLGDAITAIDRVAEYLAGVADVAALEADSRTLDAIVLNIQNLGESARCIERIAPDVVATHALDSLVGHDWDAQQACARLLRD